MCETCVWCVRTNFTKHWSLAYCMMEQVIQDAQTNGKCICYLDITGLTYKQLYTLYNDKNDIMITNRSREKVNGSWKRLKSRKTGKQGKRTKSGPRSSQRETGDQEEVA